MEDKLTSLDYMKLISWFALNKYNTILNRTQMQKILFICYGIYLAVTGKTMFDDDRPKAWPFGPVFPRVNKRYNQQEIITMSESEKDAFRRDSMALRIVDSIVFQYYNMSATQLSEWSHQKGGPWYKTIYGEDGSNKDIKWNQEIKPEYLKEYFKQD